jgi:hypothetical protein
MFWIHVTGCGGNEPKKKGDGWMFLDDYMLRDKEEIDAAIRYHHGLDNSDVSFKWEIAVPPSEVIEKRLNDAEVKLYFYKKLVAEYGKQLEDRLLAEINGKDN